MKVITKEYKVYEFNELKEDVKQKVIDKWYENEDYLFLTNDIKEEKNQIDKYFTDVTLIYSLSYSQGDGLSFKGEFNLLQWLKDKTNLKTSVINALNEYIYTVNSKGSKGHYCYASKWDIQYDYNSDIDYPHIEKIWVKIFCDIQDYYIDICKKLEEFGYSILDYRMNFKEFNEMCQSNEYNFLEDGKMVNY